MSTYAAMKTRIADELVRDDLSSQTALAIQTAIQMWEGERFWFNEGRFHLSTVASQEYYDWSVMTYAADDSLLDDDETLLEIDSITCLYNGNTFTLTERTQSWFDREQAPSTQYVGVPADYAVFGNQLRLSPVPDGVYQLTISGLYRLPALALDADTNAWMTEGEALIRTQAKILLCQDIIRDADAIPLLERSLSLAESALSRKSSRKTYTGRIAAWC